MCYPHDTQINNQPLGLELHTAFRTSWSCIVISAGQFCSPRPITQSFPQGAKKSSLHSADYHSFAVPCPPQQASSPPLETPPSIPVLVALDAVQQPPLPLDKGLGQVDADAEKHKDGPLPAEGVDGDAKDEPPHQLEVGEEVKGASRAGALEQARHVDPAAHPKGAGPGERVDEEHEQDARVDANVPVADGANGRDVGAVDGGHGRVRRREGLEIPVGRRVGVGEAVVGQKGQRRALEARGHDDDVGVDDLVVARASLGDAPGAPVHAHAALDDGLDVAADPGGLAVAQLGHDVRVDHGRVHEEAVAARGRNVLEVAVEELAQQELGDEGEHGLLAEDVEGQQRVDDNVARDDPFLGARDDGHLGGVGPGGELERLNGRRAAPDDGELLALGVLARQLAGVVDVALERVQPGQVGHLDVAAGADGGDQAVEAAVGRVVDDPAGLVVLVRLVDPEVEPGLVLEVVPAPELLGLVDDLLAVGISALPLDRGVESVHDGVDLEGRGVVDSLPAC